MADSLLSGIDFDNLPSEVPPYIIKALCIATQERYVIAHMGKTGTFSTVGFNPSQYKSIFPYKDNTNHKYALNEGDPLQDFTGEIENLLSIASLGYADIERWNDADTASETSIHNYRLSDITTDDPAYGNRLLEVTGYTSYPDLSVYAPEEVKKWYDMLTQLKFILRTSGIQSITDDYSIFKGLFDMETAPFYISDQQLGTGAKWYTSPGGTREDPAVTTPYADFKSDNSALFGTLPDSFDEDSDTAGTYPPPTRGFLYAAEFKRDIFGDYSCYAQAIKPTYIQDWTDRIAEGITGRPLSYKHQMAVTIVESFPTGHDTNMSYPYSTTGDSERYYCGMTFSKVGNKDIITPDYDISPADFPANITDISSNESVSAYVQYSNNFFYKFLEEWDGEGGFDYYTPE